MIWYSFNENYVELNTTQEKYIYKSFKKNQIPIYKNNNGNVNIP